jgi:hypothetical protein
MAVLEEEYRWSTEQLEKLRKQDEAAGKYYSLTTEPTTDH